MTPKSAHRNMHRKCIIPAQQWEGVSAHCTEEIEACCSAEVQPFVGLENPVACSWLAMAHLEPSNVMLSANIIVYKKPAAGMVCPFKQYDVYICGRYYHLQTIHNLILLCILTASSSLGTIFIITLHTSEFLQSCILVFSVIQSLVYFLSIIQTLLEVCTINFNISNTNWKFADFHYSIMLIIEWSKVEVKCRQIFRDNCIYIGTTGTLFSVNKDSRLF